MTLLMSGMGVERSGKVCIFLRENPEESCSYMAARKAAGGQGRNLALAEPQWRVADMFEHTFRFHTCLLDP